MFQEWEIGRTVRLPFLWKNGQLRNLDGSRFPELKEDAVGEVVVLVDMLKQLSDRERMREGAPVTIADEGQILYLALSLESVPPKHHETLFHPQEPTVDPAVGLIPVKLKTSLALVSSPGRIGRLFGGACWIPALETTARSPNHALSQLSTAFEPDRLSHTGNVFTRGYLKRNGRWVRLDEIRNEVMAAQGGLNR